MLTLAVLLAPVAEPTSSVPGAAVADGGSTAVSWWLYVVIAAVILAAGAAALVLSLRKKPSEAQEEPCPNCGKVMMPDWPRCMFCKTPRGFRQAALEVVSGPLLGRTIVLDLEVTTIGSAPGSTVTLSDAGVSRKHAGIRHADGGFELADLGSTNGVYVNGEKVARRKLRLGDVIRVGTTEMVFKN